MPAGGASVRRTVLDLVGELHDQPHVHVGLDQRPLYVFHDFVDDLTVDLAGVGQLLHRVFERITEIVEYHNKFSSALVAHYITHYIIHYHIRYTISG